MAGPAPKYWARGYAKSAHPLAPDKRKIHTMDNPDEVWTDEDDAAIIYESLPEWHPALFFDAFRLSLESDAPFALDLLRQGFVTPESVEAWGDFSEALNALRGLRISMKLLLAEGAPDVAYVRIVDTPFSTHPDMREVPAVYYATLVWRPEIAATSTSSWRVHGIGEAIPPERLPRTAQGFDPSTLPGRFQ